MERKVALVTGGSRGIGKEIVLQLAQEGYHVLFTYRNSHECAKRVEEEAVDRGGRATAFLLDISNRKEVRAVIDEMEREWGCIDVLVNNAGVIKDCPLIMMREEWDSVLQVNLYGTFYVTQRVLFAMMKRRSGRVINISSISGVIGLAGQANYSCAKAGVIGLTRSLAKEVANYGITVNCVAPAGVETEMIESLSERERDKLLEMSPMKRFGSPTEVAKVVSFLASEKLCPEFLNGAVIPIDGGMGVV